MRDPTRNERKHSLSNLRHYRSIHWVGLRQTTRASVSIASFRAEIWTWDVPNMKPLCYPLGRGKFTNFRNAYAWWWLNKSPRSRGCKAGEINWHYNGQWQWRQPARFRSECCILRVLDRALQPNICTDCLSAQWSYLTAPFTSSQQLISSLLVQ